MAPEVATMRWKLLLVASCASWIVGGSGVYAQRTETPPANQIAATDVVKDLVGRLDVERYKATIKGLTQFGDRGRERTGTARQWTGSRRN